MKPDYAKDKVRLFNCDCMEFMKDVPDNYYDIIITSPPYNLGKMHTGSFRHNPYKDDFDEGWYQGQQCTIINECIRVLKNDGSMFYNHKNRIKDKKTITPYSWILQSNAVLKQELVWFNGSQNFNKCRFYPMTERIYWLSKTKETKFHNNIDHHDLFKCQPVGTSGFHKRAFPLDLCKNLLANFPKGLKVFDPYSGSGTLACACLDMGFEFDGCELDKECFDNAVERINNYSQLYLEI